MARYIDANALVRTMTLQANRTALGEIAPPDLSYNEMLEIIADAPTADVAPKSEVAREIFEEIEKILSSYKILPVPPMDFQIISLNDLAELKKKYTEGEE